jgi:adenosyl cobinamide kinase/adenosyl cobinamide phosphate guanylyltransferase
MLALYLGGTRSGKSELAEAAAARIAGGGAVTYVATAQVTDGEMALRVDAHRRRRPADWTTVELGAGGDLAGMLFRSPGTVLVDSLGTWLAGFPAFRVDGEGLVRAIRLRKGSTVVVSEEVGMSVHPPTEAGRAFQDAIGELNRAVAEVADEVYLVVAGIATRLGSPCG